MAHQARDGRENNFHIIRHLAAICVVLTHSYAITTGVYAKEPLVSLTGLSIGHYAVDVFFILSGFLVTQSIVRNSDLLRFTLARLLRIVPALLASVLLTTMVLGPIVSTFSPLDYFESPVTWNYLIGAASTISTDGTLPGVFAGQPENGTINDPLWTLKYELISYALLAVITAACLVRARSLVVAMAVLMVTAYAFGRVFYPWPESEGTINNLLHLLPAFLAGSAAYLLRGHIRYSLALIAVLAIATYLTRGTAVFEIVEVLLMVSVIMWIAFLPSSMSRTLAEKGDFSYGIYIFHYPLMQTAYLWFPGLDAISLFVTGLVLTLPAAALSWYWIEAPALDARHGIEKRIRSLRGFQLLEGKLRKRIAGTP